MEYGAVIQYVSGPMRLRVAVFSVFFAALLWSINGVRVSASPTAIRVFDEFGVSGHCDLTARLDNFAIALEQTPGSTGYIVSYGPEGDGTGSGKSTLPRMKDYLVNMRAMLDSRIKTVYGGRNQVLQEPKIQLW